MTKYLETKRNSIEEAISSVVKGEGFASDAQRRAAFAQGYKAKGKKDKNEELDENGFVVGKVKMPKMKGGANEEQKKKSQILYDKIMPKAKEVGIADEVDKYMKMHLDSMLKGDPKLGFGRTDIKESYQEMIARIMSQRSMR